MGNSVDKREAPIGLRHDGERQVVVTPSTMDRFVLAQADAVRACVNQAQSSAFQALLREKLNRLRTTVATWCASKDDVVRAYFGHRESDRWLLVILLQRPDHAFDLDDAVTELDLQLSRDVPEFPTSLLTLPADRPEALEAFLDVEDAVEVYASSRGSSGGR